MSCKKHLENAFAASGDERLRHLVAAWRAKRATEIAELVVRLGSDLDRARATIAGKTADARLATWLATDKLRDDALTGWLLASPPLQDNQTQHYKPRINRLQKWLPDPRITLAMLGALEGMPMVQFSGQWNPMFAHIEGSGDATLVPRVQAARANLLEEPYFLTRIDKAIAVLAKKKPPKLDAAEQKLVAQLVDAAGPSEDAMLAAIWSAPEDDGPRLVYADFLQQRGDPRGEFIVLQCANMLDVEGRKRLRMLNAKYRRKWLGPIEPAILEQKSFTFERGFLATCWLCVMWGSNADDVSEPRERAIRAMQEHPAWATLRELKTTSMANRTRAPLLAHLKRLGVKVTFAK